MGNRAFRSHTFKAGTFWSGAWTGVGSQAESGSSTFRTDTWAAGTFRSYTWHTATRIGAQFLSYRRGLHFFDDTDFLGFIRGVKYWDVADGGVDIAGAASVITLASERNRRPKLLRPSSVTTLRPAFNAKLILGEVL